jgi:hypothetical protein
MQRGAHGSVGDGAATGSEQQTVRSSERSELEVLSGIMRRAERAGIDPHRVMVALDLPPATVAELERPPRDADARMPR